MESSLKYVIYLAPHLYNCHVGNLQLNYEVLFQKNENWELK